MKLELIDASEMRRIWSLRWAIATAFLAAIPAAYVLLPNDWLPAIPDWLKAALALVTLFAAGTTAAVRVVKQPVKPDDNDPTFV